MPGIVRIFLATLLVGARSHPAGLECGTDATTRLKAGQVIMRSPVVNAATDSPVKVVVKGNLVTVTSKAGIYFAARAFGAGATLAPMSGDSSLKPTGNCSNQVFTVSGNSTTYSFTQDHATKIVVGYASKPGAVSLVTAEAAAVASPQDMSCPSSPAPIHASAKITTTAAASCDKVKDEVRARIAGQASGAWHDPHNNGTYYLDDDTNRIQVHRVTGNHKPGPYTDKITLTLTSSGDSCTIEGCSVSQTTSIADFGTNYCNIRMLYCGSADGCKPVKNDFTSPEGTVKTSIGASKGISNCLKVSAVIV